MFLARFSNLKYAPAVLRVGGVFKSAALVCRMVVAAQKQICQSAENRRAAAEASGPITAVIRVSAHRIRNGVMKGTGS